MPNLHKLFPVVFFVFFSVLTAQTTTSITNGNWAVAATWDNGVPSVSLHAVIANTVTIQTETVYVKNLTINAGATLNASAFFAKIRVKGDWTNNGTFNTSTTGEVSFYSGAANQIVDPGGDTFPDLILNNSGFTILISDHIDINGDLTFEAGTLDLDTSDKNVNIDGDVEITSGAVWTKGDGTVTFDGDDQDFTDYNGSPNNIGDIVVD